MKNTMSSTPESWGDRIAVEEIGGVPFLMYVERPKRIGDLFGFAERWGVRPYIVQGERILTFAGLKSAVQCVVEQGRARRCPDGAKARASARGPARRHQDAACLAPRTLGDRDGPAWRGGRSNHGR
jgi:hypothetical protein